jgi:hypothetical protein
MSLWRYGLSSTPTPAERKSIITPQRAQILYDATAKVASSVNVFRQAASSFGYLGDPWKIVSNAMDPIEQVLQALMRELSLERHAGPFPAQAHDVPPDAKWFSDVRALARESDNGMTMSMARIAPTARTLMADAKGLADMLLVVYQEGIAERLPVPLMSALKSAVGVLDAFADLELFPSEVERIRSEVAGLLVFAKAFGRPEATALEAAREALKSL